VSAIPAGEGMSVEHSASGDVRRVRAEVNVGAIEQNCSMLLAQVPARTALCAVVKAGGYGHGAVASARAAVAGGAGWLAVADGAEARELRDAGLRDAPILAMGALSPVELAEALSCRCDVLVWSEEAVAIVAAAGGGRVHVKLDTGMGRLGTREREVASRTVAAAVGTEGVELAGVMTHFATADERDDGGFFSSQLAAFTDWALPVRAGNPGIIVHAANSAATLRDPGAHFDMVRCGIAIYGMDPFGVDPLQAGLSPALELRSYVAEVKACGDGESVGYGRRFIAQRPTNVGVIPVGYGDGWRRGLSGNARVLVAGESYPLVGTVSMDSFTVDLGDGPHASSLRGEPAILIGSAGGQRITAEEVAKRLATINYEITCGLTSRVPRSYSRDGQPLAPPP
jgi:alanine racemase